MSEIDVQIRHLRPFVCERTLREAAERTLAAHGAAEGATIDVAVVDDPSIHRLNRERLNHDWPTDVISFLYEEEPIAGELIVSADTAERVAGEFGWDPQAELALYVVHGTLHLLGYDDQADEDRTAMQREENRVLATFGWTPPRDRESPTARTAASEGT
ncbi:MAG TPA: rRNA maturation RNase YbeY [Pirellulaceae bacterium]|jgi:probable rRNA maturation factor|nr:rRNA maturation RNase YbeY [Pirellulaceae bacterium]